MSYVRLVIREASQDWYADVHGASADRFVAALSTDPTTLDELVAGLGRYEAAQGVRSWFRAGLRDEPYDAGLVVIDLAARLVFVNSTYSSPGDEGEVEYHDGRATGQWLRYCLADDWYFLHGEGFPWKPTADARRRKRAEQRPLEARAVFFGRPLLEFLAREVFAAFARRQEIEAEVRAKWARKERERLAKERGVPIDEVEPDLPSEEVEPKTWPGQEVYASPFYDTLRQIHAAWLMTPRDDLSGACPREIALERRDQISWDLQHQCDHWSKLQKCPPGLDEASYAYRYGGFGTHELVVHYDLVRKLLWSCWEQLEHLAEAPNPSQRPESLSVGDFLTGEVPRLERIRDEWLDEPEPEFHGRTPRAVIARERARLPEGMSRHESIVDPDCPCCQMLADLPGPAFWGLDGSHMDDEFAFDISHRTREEWDQEQRRWQEFNRKFNEERAERERLGVADSTAREDGSNAHWSRSFMIDDTADVPLGVRIFQIGAGLAGIIVELRERFAEDAQAQIDRLNRNFANLREVLHSSDTSLAAALLDPVVDRFVEDLESLPITEPRFDADPEQLVGMLRRLTEPPPPETPAQDWESDDEGVPF